MTTPVAQAMSQLGFEVKLLALTTAGSFLEGRGVPYFGYRDFPEATNPDVRRYGVELAGPPPTEPPRVPYEESVAYLGINFLDLVESLGEPEARVRYATRQRQAFLPIAAMRRLLERERPDLVVITSSPRSEKALAVAATQLRVPVVCMVDLFDVHGMPTEQYAGYADRFLVLNEAVRESFLAKGCRPEQVVVTGNPAFDRLLDKDMQAAGTALRRARRWAPDERIVLWASQVEPAIHPFTGAPGDPSLPTRIEKELRNFVGRHDGARLIVRYHPSDPTPFVEGPRTEFSPLSEDLGALLHAVDIVVVMTSTVGLEAAIVGKPVVSVDCSVFSPGVQYMAAGVSDGVATPEEIGPKLTAILKGDKIRTIPRNTAQFEAATKKVCAVLLGCQKMTNSK